MSIIKSIKQVLGLSGTASENHFWDGSVPNQLSLKRGTPDAPGAELIKALDGALSFPSQGQSLAANGYVKLPGGLIIQWGTTVGTTDVGGGLQCPYAISFPNAVLCVIGTNGDANNQPTLQAGVSQGLSNKDRAILRALDTTTGVAIANTVVRIDWIAIGH